MSGVHPRLSAEASVLLIENLPGILWTTDSDLVFTLSEGADLSVLGIRPGTVAGVDLYTYFGVQDASFPPIAAHLRALAGEVSSYEFEWQGVCFNTVVHPLRDATGDIIGTIGLAVDITTRKRAEERLAETQERLAIAQQVTHMGVWDWNVVTGELVWTDEVYRIFGHAPGAITPSYERFVSQVHPEDREALDSAVRRALDGGTRYRAEYRGILPDGTLRHFRAEGNVLRDERGAPIRMLGINADITDQKVHEAAQGAVEARLRHQQKLEAIGTLASGVAHEINNPIQGMLGYAELIEQLVPHGSRIAEYAHEIVEATERVAVIVRDLLVFARREDEVPTEARISELLARTLPLIRTVLRKDQILLRVAVTDDLPPVMCRPASIQQVLMNLLTNARDALNERYPDEHPDKVITITGEPFEEGASRWLRLTVADRGIGLRPHTVDRIFDPFFTTKPPVGGTGLGLSVSHGIVTRHGGRLVAESPPEGGTRFHVELPLRR